jgi:hypothetical protein
MSLREQTVAARDGLAAVFSLSRPGRAGSRLVRANSLFAQHHFQRTKVGERRLQQVEAYERSKPQPIRAVIVRQQQAAENEHPGKPANDQLKFHKFFEFRSNRGETSSGGFALFQARLGAQEK